MNDTIKCPSLFLESTKLFSCLPKILLERLGNRTHWQYIHKGGCFDVQPNKVYVVSSGHIMIFRETFNGSIFINSIEGADGVYGTIYFEQRILEPAKIQALNNTLLWTVNLNGLIDILVQHKEFVRRLLDIQAKQQKVASAEMEGLALKSTEQRLGCYLLRLWLKAKKKETVRLPIEKKTIANKLGMTLETLSRSLKSLSAHKLITIENYDFKVLDEFKLISLSCSSCSRSFPCKDLVAIDTGLEA